MYVLPSFDPLLVGYEKKTNPMVPPEYLRDIYTLQGIIRPVIVAGGPDSSKAHRLPSGPVRFAVSVPPLPAA